MLAFIVLLIPGLYQRIYALNLFNLNAFKTTVIVLIDITPAAIYEHNEMVVEAEENVDVLKKIAEKLFSLSS